MAHLGPHLYSEGDQDGNLIESASELFEIDDFTSPSPWEKFVSQIEQLLREWQLHGKNVRLESSGSSEEAPWKARTQNLSFYGFEFDVTEFSRGRQRQNEDPKDQLIDAEPTSSRSWRGITPHFVHDMMLSGTKEFPTSMKCHSIHYYYGLEHFIVLSPSKSEKEDIDNETRSKMAMSTLAVALNNSECAVPCFVQVMDRYKNMFNGVAVGGGFRTNYEMIVLGKKPPNCDNLTGLLNLFKTKLRLDCANELELPSVKVTARFTFVLDDWTTHGWSQPPPDLDMFSGVFGPNLVQDLSQLPFGTAKDPVKNLKLHASWYDLSEDILVDNDVHSDLDLMEAPAWAISCQFEDQPQCLLYEYLKLFNSICDQEETIKQLLGEEMFKETNRDENLDKIPDVFDRLTGGSSSSYSLSSLITNPVSRLGRATSLGGPIKADHLIRILDYLFPDAAPDPTYPYPADLSSNQLKFSSQRGISIKSCPIDGLVWRLSIVFAHCLHVLGGLKPLAHLMHEFLLEVRFRWENGQILPGLPPGVPDHGFCLLHQKLQMINCCIEKKVARDAKVEKSVQDDPEQNEEETTESSDEEQFYDCDEDEKQGNSSSIPVWSKEPVGRFKKLGKSKLLRHDDFLFIPICQDPTPLTEDMLAEQAEVMLQLGFDAKGAQMRAKMQSASLLSDMESFKAANPGSVLADFVRWHSPRDWDSEKGTLSARMEAEGNLWKEAWENAKPVPAKRQKRLFDDTREAEKVLQYLASLKPSEAAHMLMPVLQHCSIARILSEASESSLEGIPQISDIIGNAMQKLSILSRLRCLPEVKHFKSIDGDEDADILQAELVRRTAFVNDVIGLIHLAERKISQAFSLQAKFLKNAEKVESEAQVEDKEAVSGQLNAFVKQLYVKPEVNAIGGSRGPVGQLVTQMFKDAFKAANMILDNQDLECSPFPKPYSREFVLKANVPRPYAHSQASPQRMYGCLKNNEFRVASAFTIDQQFM